ncbi:ORF113 [Staphylococcus phage 92]|uniref:ORF113 n=1 Tax=Staphylococcus phage 92 TaxID=2908151 RepID=Q4ZAF1_9CAUD|nr:ORF113 [Staphylococcus phage 92]
MVKYRLPLSLMSQALQVIQLNQLRVHGNVINMVLTTWKKMLDSQTVINQSL